MSATVVDASALAAVVFDEPEAAPVMAGIAGPLLAPSLLRYDMASVCAVKLAREPAAVKLTMQRYGLLEGLDIEFVEPDWHALPLLAREWNLSAHDAAYLQLALARGARLVTLDAQLALACDLATR